MASKWTKIWLSGYIIFNVLVTWGLFTERLTFGYGLADVLFMLPHLGLLIVSVIMLIFFKIEKEIVLLVVIIIIVITTALKLSYFRGMENPWNGKIIISH